MIDGAKYCVFADTNPCPSLHYYRTREMAERMYGILCAEYPDAYVDITAIDGDGRLSHWVKRNDEVEETA